MCGSTGVQHEGGGGVSEGFRLRAVPGGAGAMGYATPLFAASIEWCEGRVRRGWLRGDPCVFSGQRGLFRAYGCVGRAE